MRLFYRTVLACTLLFTFSPFAWGGDLVGLWQAYDNHTGNLEALIHIKKLPDNTYEGIVEKIYPDKPENAAMICSDCPGSYYNKPILGMRILSGMKRKDKLTFDGGNILDPDEAKVYQCRIQLSEDGKTIQVTGYINYVWIGQSEIWQRVN
jgi:uncharacterized protein (DUF2147 family)